MSGPAPVTRRRLPRGAVGFALLAACGRITPPTWEGPPRTFASSFESPDAFADFYTEDAAAFASVGEYSDEVVRTGERAWRAEVLAARDDDNDGLPYRPHRAYPTVQLHRTEGGSYRTPCLVTLWVWLDMTLADRPTGHVDDWVSFVTLSADASDDWTRVVLANLSAQDYLHLAHVPRQGVQEPTFTMSAADDPDGALRFPRRTWVRLDVYLDFDRDHGEARLWQDGVLMSTGDVRGGAGSLAQAHFGLYASAAVSGGLLYNDDLRIVEVGGPDEAVARIEAEVAVLESEGSLRVPAR